MGFIVALMLTYMDEESTFWMIHCLISHYDMDKYFKQNFPGLEKSFYVLLKLMKKHLNKLYELFKSKDVQPTMYASRWFITMFAVNLSFDVLVRVFDVLLLEREKIIYRIALAILQTNENKLLKCKRFDEILEKLKFLHDDIKVEDLLKRAFNFSISRNQIKVKK